MLPAFNSGGHLGLFSNSTGIRLTERMTHCLNLSLKPVMHGQFTSNRLCVRVRRSVQNYSICLVRPAYRPIGSRLVRLLVVVSTYQHTSTHRVATMIPCCNCTQTSHGATNHRSVATGLITGLVTGTKTDQILTVSLRSTRVRNCFSVPYSRICNDPILVSCVTDGGLRSLMIISPSIKKITHTHTFTGGLGSTPLTVVSGHQRTRGITRIVGIVKSIHNGATILISSVVSATNAVYRKTELLGRRNTRRICTYTARPIFSPPTIRHLSDKLFRRIVIAGAVPVATTHRFSRLAILSVTGLLNRAV